MELQTHDPSITNAKLVNSSKPAIVNNCLIYLNSSFPMHYWRNGYWFKNTDSPVKTSMEFYNQLLLDEVGNFKEQLDMFKIMPKKYIYTGLKDLHNIEKPISLNDAFIPIIYDNERYFMIFKSTQTSPSEFNITFLLYSPYHQYANCETGVYKKVNSVLNMLLFQKMKVEDSQYYYINELKNYFKHQFGLTLRLLKIESVVI